MHIKDYFKIQFKHPILNSDDNEKEVKKASFLKDMENNFSSLESIELLSSNSKYSDSKILMKILNDEILKTIFRFHNKQNLTSQKEACSLISDSILSELCLKELENISGFLTKEQFEENETEETLTSFQNLLNYLQKYFKKEKWGSLHTPQDDFKKRKFVQLSFISSTIFLILFSIVYNKIKYPQIRNDFAQIQFMTTEKGIFAPESTLVADIKKEGWQEYKFKLANPQNIYKLKLDPLSQPKVKMQFKDIKFLDSNGKIIKERNFLIGDDLRLKDHKEIEYIQQMKPGRLKPGKYVELVSEGDDPQIFINCGPLKSVSEILVTFRITRGHLKFPD